LDLEDTVRVKTDIPKKLRVRKGDILICTRNGSQRLIGKNIQLDSRMTDMTWGAFMSVYRSDYNYFIKHLFETEGYYRQVQRNLGARINQITTKYLNKFKFYFPSKQEQQKISSFLSLIDKKIELLKKKKELLELYKKGVMQKIFNREIRFKDENGNDYPEWRERRLGEILEYEQPNDYIVDSTKYDESYKTPVLTAGKTFVLGYTNEKENIFKDKLPVIIFDDFTTAFKFVDFPFKVKSSAMKILYPKSNNIDIRFVFEAMKFIKFPLAEHKRYWISEYQREKIYVPKQEEQKEIVNISLYLKKSIDNLLDSIDTIKSFKKGLLQKMFI
jgi:type I restriction enzyme S subunit